jgi:hypothetical protein
LDVGWIKLEIRTSENDEERIHSSLPSERITAYIPFVWSRGPNKASAVGPSIVHQQAFLETRAYGIGT